MTVHNRLPLDSSHWRSFNSFIPDSAEIPRLIKKILEGPMDPFDHSLDELAASIFNEYSLAEATYAVYPYLLDISDRLHRTNPQLFYLAANIAASANQAPDTLSESIRAGFAEALREFERRAVERIVSIDGNFGRTYGDLRAALAFSGHCVGKLLMDVFEEEGTKRTGVYCPKCNEGMEVLLLNAGAVLSMDGREPEMTDITVALTPPEHNLFPDLRPTSWQIVASFLSSQVKNIAIGEVESQHVNLAIDLCTRGFDTQTCPQHVFTLIGSVLLVHGFKDSARRFYRFWDSVTCPKCNAPFRVAKGWWGCCELAD